MTTAVAIAVVLLVLAVTNVWVHLGPTGVHLVTGPLAALLLLLVGRMAALTWPQRDPVRESVLVLQYLLSWSAHRPETTPL
jgi:hydroxylamine reductase (hybrid-cluster protein)